MTEQELDEAIVCAEEELAVGDFVTSIHSSCLEKLIQAARAYRAKDDRQEKLVEALKKAKHELVSQQGLFASDMEWQARLPHLENGTEVEWQIHTPELLCEISEALEAQ